MSQRKTLLKYTKYVMWGTVALIPPAGFFYLLEFYTHNPFAEVRPWAQLFNIVLFELLAGIFLCITGRLRTSFYFTSLRLGCQVLLYRIKPRKSDILKIQNVGTKIWSSVLSKMKSISVMIHTHR